MQLKLLYLNKMISIFNVEDGFQKKKYVMHVVSKIEKKRKFSMKSFKWMAANLKHFKNIVKIVKSLFILF